MNSCVAKSFGRLHVQTGPISTGAKPQVIVGHQPICCVYCFNARPKVTRRLRAQSDGKLDLFKSVQAVAVVPREVQIRASLE